MRVQDHISYMYSKEVDRTVYKCNELGISGTVKPLAHTKMMSAVPLLTNGAAYSALTGRFIE